MPPVLEGSPGGGSRAPLHPGGLRALLRASSLPSLRTFGEAARLRAMALRSTESVRPVQEALCAWPGCGAVLRAGARMHCRRCAGWYCAEHAGHASMVLRLALGTGEPDAKAGVWSRVCLRCFRQRFADECGTVDPGRRWASLPLGDATAAFGRMRRPAVEARRLAAAQALGRYVRLCAVDVGDRRALQAVVPWERDDAARECRLCDAPLTIASAILGGPRRHHCRLCGLVICDECTVSIPLLRNGAGVVQGTSGTAGPKLHRAASSPIDGMPPNGLDGNTATARNICSDTALPRSASLGNVSQTADGALRDNGKSHLGRSLSGSALSDGSKSTADVQSAKVCTKCDDLVRPHIQEDADSTARAVARLCAELRQVREQIADGLLAQYHALVAQLRVRPADAALRHDARAARETLVLLLRHAHGLARRLRALGAESPGELGALCAAAADATAGFVADAVPDMHVLPMLLAESRDVERLAADEYAPATAHPPPTLSMAQSTASLSSRADSNKFYVTDDEAASDSSAGGTESSVAESVDMTSGDSLDLKASTPLATPPIPKTLSHSPDDQPPDSSPAVATVYREQLESLQTQLRDALRERADADTLAVLHRSIGEIQAELARIL